MTPELAAVASAHGGVFTRAEAMSCHYTSEQIRHRLRVGRWRVVRRGIYTTGDRWPALDPYPPLGLDAAACCLLVRGAVVSDETAATLQGVELVGRQSRQVHMSRRQEDGGDCYGKRLRVWPAPLPPAHLAHWGALPVTSVARTVVDLARRKTFRAGVVAADSALHKGLVTVDDLQSVLSDCMHWPGGQIARSAVALADARAESALESLSRIMFVEQHLPMPALQQWVGGYRVDFLWDGVIGEADGAKKYDGSNTRALLEEKRRQERLEDLGFVVVRWDWDDVTRHAVTTAARIRRAMARAQSRAA